MKITDVRVKHVESDSKITWVATITLMTVSLFMIFVFIEGENGLFVAMPSKKTATAV